MIVIAGLVDDEDAPEADALLREVAQKGAIVPALFWDELRSVLLVLERKARSSRTRTEAHLRHVRSLPIAVVPPLADEPILRVARAHGLTAYDAAYAALAAERGLPLATLDKALLRAGRTGAFALWSPT